MNYTQNVDIIDEILNEQTNSKIIWQSERFGRLISLLFYSNDYILMSTEFYFFLFFQGPQIWKNKILNWIVLYLIY